MIDTTQTGDTRTQADNGDVLNAIAANLSEHFFSELLEGVDLGGRSTGEIRQSVVDQVRASFRPDEEPEVRAFVTLQPIVHLESNAIIGYEATVVFNQEAPASRTALELAGERSAAMQVEAVRISLQRLDEVPRGQFLSVKVTTAGLQHDRLISTLLDSNVDRLVVDIAEGDATDVSAVRDGIDALAHLGVRAAIDGAGHGLFRGASLYEVSPALLKIDASIIDGCADDVDKRVHIEKLIAVGRRLGALVVATGVDTREALNTVFVLGVDAAQGGCVQPTEMVGTATTGWSESSSERSTRIDDPNTNSVFSLTNSV